MTREIAMLEAVVVEPESPFVALIAGSQMEEKLPILEHILPRVDRLFIRRRLGVPIPEGEEKQPAGFPDGRLPPSKPRWPLPSRQTD